MKILNISIIFMQFALIFIFLWDGTAAVARQYQFGVKQLKDSRGQETCLKLCQIVIPCTPMDRRTFDVFSEVRNTYFKNFKTQEVGSQKKSTTNRIVKPALKAVPNSLPRLVPRTTAKPTLRPITKATTAKYVKMLPRSIPTTTPRPVTKTTKPVKPTPALKPVPAMLPRLMPKTTLKPVTIAAAPVKRTSVLKPAPTTPPQPVAKPPQQMYKPLPTPKIVVTKTSAKPLTTAQPKIGPKDATLKIINIFGNSNHPCATNPNGVNPCFVLMHNSTNKENSNNLNRNPNNSINKNKTNDSDISYSVRGSNPNQLMPPRNDNGEACNRGSALTCSNNQPSCQNTKCASNVVIHIHV